MAGSRFIIVDDHPLFREALHSKLVSHYRQAIEIAESADVLMRMLQDDRLDTDLVLLDLQMPDALGFSVLLELRKRYPAIPVAIVSGVTKVATIQCAFDYGAAAYIPKAGPTDNFRAAIDTIMAGGVWTPPGYDPTNPGDQEARALASRLRSLTPQQWRVLGMLGEGLLNKQIAFQLAVSEATVKAHVSAILQKLNVDSRTQAVIAIGRSGVLASLEEKPAH